MPSLQIRGPGPPSALSRRPLSFRFNLHSLAENPGPSPAAQPPKRSFPPSPDTPGNRVFHGTGKCQGGSSAGAERVLLARGRQGAASRKPPGCSRPHPAPSAWAAGPAAPLPTSAFFSLREPMPGLRCTEGAGLTCDGGPDRTWGCPVLPVHQLLPWRPGPLEAEASGTVSWGPLGLSVGQAGAEGAWGGCLWAPPRRSPGEQVGVVVVVGELVEEGAGLQDEGGQHHAGTGPCPAAAASAGPTSDSCARQTLSLPAMLRPAAGRGTAVRLQPELGGEPGGGGMGGRAATRTPWPGRHTQRTCPSPT